MSSVERINRAARSYTAQELWAALASQVRFRNFTGAEVVEDLYDRPHLWSSFIFTRPVYSADLTGLGIRNQVDLLLDLAQRPLSSSNSYVADTLYLLAKDNSSTVSTLLSLGEKWQADSIEIIDGRQTRNKERLNRQLAQRLKRPSVDAVVISKGVGSLVVAKEKITEVYSKHGKRLSRERGFRANL